MILIYVTYLKGNSLLNDKKSLSSTIKKPNFLLNWPHTHESDNLGAEDFPEHSSKLNCIKQTYLLYFNTKISVLVQMTIQFV